MSKNIIMAGILGGVVLILWNFILNGLFGLNARINMKQIPQERKVYELLKETIVEPGGYVCNPELNSEGMYPENVPVYTIQYSGFGHEAAGIEALLGLILFLITPILGTWMLSFMSERIISSFRGKVLFFTAIGILIALSGREASFGIGGLPIEIAFFLTLKVVIEWTLVGLVVAWIMKKKTSFQGSPLL